MRQNGEYMDNCDKEYMKMHREADIYTDSSADYSLPDYNGDIKKVLFTSANVLPAAKINDSESVSSSGVVSYDILYINEENELDHVSFTSDYDVSAKLRSQGVCGADVETRVSSFSHRLFGPRRVNMKATLLSEVRAICTEELDGADKIRENPDAECVIKNIEVANTLLSHSAEREYAECIAKLDGVIADEVDVLYSTASYGFDSVKAEEGGVALKGAFYISAILRCDGAAPALYRKRIPFDELIETEGVGANMSVLASAVVSSLVCETVGNDDGASVNASIIAEYSFTCTENKSHSFVKDAFLKSADCENSYEKINYTTHLATESKILNYTYTIPFSDVCESAVRSVIYTSAPTRISNVELTENGVCTEVEFKINGICSTIDEDGKVGYFALKSASKTNEKVNLGSQICEKTAVECKARTIDAVATIDEENIYIDITYAIDVDATVSNSELSLSDIHAKDGDEIKPRGSKISVYYPTGEDSLFSVARMYHTSVKDIAALNMLSESVINNFSDKSSLSGVKRLIIK